MSLILIIDYEGIFFIFLACPCGRFAALMPTRSACYGLTVLRPTPWL
ncbi:MAG: hypothetical protein NZ455_03395 [Bacteroidia bacterium]|nr:hypothetical protein [Bacteroidia bacterium]